MALAPFTVETFGGLDLLSDPIKIGATGATACADIALDTPGRVRARDGYFKLATLATAARRVHAYVTTSATQYVTSSATKLEAFSSAGAAIASVSAVGPHSMVTYGGSAITPVVYTTATTDSTVRKWNGTAWSTIATVAVGVAVTQDTDSDRLVVAGGEGGSRVRFSDPGLPETFTSTSFVDLTPGDGEDITAAVNWQGLVFVFKQSRFFVFTGEGEDAGGNPIFDYRTVEGIGARQGYGPVCATPQGVYFIGQDGVYLTTGAAPVLISAPLLPLFGAMPGSFTPSKSTHLAWHKGRLFVVLGKSSGDPRVFVWYRNTDSWVEWPSLMAGKASGGFCGSQQLATTPFVNGDDLALYAMTTSCTTDGESSSGAGNGTAINWSYTSGRYPLSEPGRVAVTMESSITGYATSGAIYTQITTDSFPTMIGAEALLGTDPTTPTEGFTGKDNEGKLYQHHLESLFGGASFVSRVTHYVSFVKPAGIQ